MTLPKSFLAVAIFALLQGNAMAKYKICEDNTQCAPGTTCIPSVRDPEISRCLTSCETGADCPKNEFCDPNANVCRLYCDTSSQCPEGYACKLFTGQDYGKCTKDSPNTPNI